MDPLTGPRRSAPMLRWAIERGERLLLASIVFDEWLRGPRTKAELEAQEMLFPSESAVPFGPTEALAASRLRKSLPRSRGREMNIAIAAMAVARDATLWTLNARDSADIPDLCLFSI